MLHPPGYAKMTSTPWSTSDFTTISAPVMTVVAGRLETEAIRFLS
jgi:hypothetical protein